MHIIRQAWEFICKPEHSNAIVAIFTAMIFLSGIIYTIFSYLQWRATKTAANAAKRSADSDVRTERAWMIIFHPNMGWDFIGNGVCRWKYTCEIHNFGRTPARILGMSISLKKIDSLSKIPEAFPYDWDRHRKYSKIIVSQDDSIPIFEDVFPVLDLPVGDTQQVETGHLFLYGYGFVRYLDTASIDENDFRETRFCHCFQAPNIVRPCVEAPEGYHRAT